MYAELQFGRLGFKTIQRRQFRQGRHQKFGRPSLVELDFCSLYVLIRAMTDRPASWRMPTPKQMEKLAASMGKGTPSKHRLGPQDEMPDE
jgi:hypothetical protein